jgi:hypothetical protein
VKTNVFTTLCALLALLIAACGGSTDTSHNSNTPAAGTANRAATTAPGTTNTASSTAPTEAAGNKIGIAECDEFIAKYDACVTGKVPEAARAQYKATLEQWRKSWRDLAANPQTRGSLAQACRTSVEQARASMKAFGCEF